MYNAINFSYTMEWIYGGTIIGPNPIDYTVNKASIATLLCPSDGIVNTCSGYAQYINYQPGNFNYVANTGHPRNVLLPGDPPNTGSLPPLTGIISMSPHVSGAGLLPHGGPAGHHQHHGHVGQHHRRHIEYGRGQRIARERRHRYGNRPQARTCSTPASGLIDAQINPSVPALAVVQDGLANPIPYQPWSYFKGLTWAYTDAWEQHVYAHLFPPNTKPIDTYHTDTFRCQEGDSGMCPTSNHPGGVNVSFMDGSVHFIKNSINLQPWWFMGTRGAARSSLPTVIDLDRARNSGPNDRALSKSCKRPARSIAVYAWGLPIMRVDRSSVMLTRATALFVALTVFGSGCGEETPEYDKAAKYTPEALAQELILRYRELNPSARVSSRARGSASSRSAPLTRKNPEKKVITKTTKNRSAPTIDDVLDDIKYKLTLIPDSAPAKSSKKMVATISGDSSLSDSEKKTLTDFVGRLTE